MNEFGIGCSCIFAESLVQRAHLYVPFDRVFKALASQIIHFCAFVCQPRFVPKRFSFCSFLFSVLFQIFLCLFFFFCWYAYLNGSKVTHTAQSGDKSKRFRRVARWEAAVSYSYSNSYSYSYSICIQNGRTPIKMNQLCTMGRLLGRSRRLEIRPTYK